MGGGGGGQVWRDEPGVFIISRLDLTQPKKQASGLSATHEEYREAREHRRVLAFVQQETSLPLPEMRDAMRNNGPKRRKKQELEDALERSLPSYSPEERMAVLKGMRILARVAVRTYMEEQAAGSGAATDGDGEEQG